MQIEIKILNKEFYKREKLGGTYYDHPQYETLGSAAVDLRCTEDIILIPGERKMIPTGLAIWIGSSHSSQSVAGFIMPRSGLGTKGLVLANTIGLIDEDYQGELMISALNSAQSNIELGSGDRIAQLMFIPVIKAKFKEVEEFSNKTGRAQGGFNSTGDK